MRARGLVGLVVIVVSSAWWAVALRPLIPTTSDLVALLLVLLVGPAWAYVSCLAARDEDFPEDAWRDRDGWLRLLPLAFVLAPLVVPTMVMLVQFIRDSRADHGQTWLGYGRSRPGEGGPDLR